MKDAKEIGIKADTGKVDLTYVMEYFPRAIEAIARVAEFGDVKYTKITGRSARGSWLHVLDGLKRYTAAFFRHAFCVFRGEEYDHEPEEYGLPPVLHRAQRAWNDLATLELWLIEQEKKSVVDNGKIKVGDSVTVYDRYRFALPLKAFVYHLSDSNDGIEVELLESNSASYPIGARVWIHENQIKKDSALTPKAIAMKHKNCEGDLNEYPSN